MSKIELEISVEETQEILSQDGHGAVLLDCRNPDEHEFVHLPNAILIPMDEVPDRADELHEHQEKQIITYCHMGVRSNLVAQWLRRNGFNKAQSMAGGIDAWSLNIDPTLPRY